MQTHQPRIRTRGAVLGAFAALAFAAGCATSNTTTVTVDPTSRATAEDLATPQTLNASELPAPPREFRAAWVATVANIDWPSEPGLSTEEQQAEAIAILDRAVELNLNAIVWQGRPAADALYASEYEPWSYWLTGEQGLAPDPYYDPLEFWIEESHKRGIQLHVWFNPYRANHPNNPELSEESIVNQRPDLAKKLGDDGYYWLDPAKKEVQDISYNVMMDVVTRYNVDGVHFDDYFYPYPSYNDGADFPDEDTWQEYLAAGGALSRSDWRRKAVDDFIQRLYYGIKEEKTHVQFGISPFGIWRPGNPSSIQGFDQHNVLFADAKLWLNQGWVDYYTPQLYWPVNQIPQSYPVLLQWWTEQNTMNRNLWPGLFTSRATGEGGAANNISQVMITRALVADGPGNVHFSMKALMSDESQVAQALMEGPYAREALVPTSPWLDPIPPAAPSVTAMPAGENVTLSWSPRGLEAPFQYVVYTQRGDSWSWDIVPATQTRMTAAASVDGADLTRVAVMAVDRLGNTSDAAYADVP